MQAFAPELAGLPPGYQTLGPEDRARVLLTLKADDAETYKNLRAQAIRCADH